MGFHHDNVTALNAEARRAILEAERIAQVRITIHRCSANMAHGRQSRPDYGTYKTVKLSEYGTYQPVKAVHRTRRHAARSSKPSASPRHVLL